MDELFLESWWLSFQRIMFLNASQDCEGSWKNYLLLRKLGHWLHLDNFMYPDFIFYCHFGRVKLWAQRGPHPLRYSCSFLFVVPKLALLISYVFFISHLFTSVWQPASTNPPTTPPTSNSTAPEAPVQAPWVSLTGFFQLLLLDQLD